MLYLLLSTAAPLADLITTDWISLACVPTSVMTEDHMPWTHGRRLTRYSAREQQNERENLKLTDLKRKYDAIFIGLTTDREILYNRINDRVDKMIKDGLIDEVKSFYDKGIRYWHKNGGIMSSEAIYGICPF